jgi:uncharacterized membrane protein YhhN
MPDPNSLARWLIVAGLALAAAGGVLVLIGRSGVSLGHLPGDLRFSMGGGSCFLPIATSLILSLILTIVLNVVLRLLHK